MDEGLSTVPPTPTEAPKPELPPGASETLKREPSSRGDSHRIAIFAAAAVFLVVVIRMGWVSDDAFIAIRSVDHLVHGLGFTLNLGERVQSFTSPLWALLCVPFYALTRNPYGALILPGLLCTGALAYVIARQQRTRPMAAAVVLLGLAASTSFTAFSTSGLENPLSHLLLALFIGHVLANPGRATRSLFLMAAALFLTRFDEVLFVLPALAHVLILHRRTAAQRKVVLRAAWPAIVAVGVWLAFATFYYGFPFPNTAYAKLNTAIPLGERAAQGAAYLVDVAYKDPLVSIVLILGAIVAFRPRTSPASRLLLAGTALYLVYVVSIGGDFMSGRFLTAAYLAIWLVLIEPLGEVPFASHAVSAGALFVLVAFSFSDRRVERMQTDCVVPRSGIVDERECYVENTGLAANVRQEKWRTHGYLRDFENAVGNSPDQVVVFDLAGLVSYANRSEKHIVERFALTEPLLARIKLVPGNGWRIGHFFRELPAGYLETLRGGTNVIVDPCIHHLYERLSPVVHGPLFSFERFADIVSLNLGSGTCAAP